MLFLRNPSVLTYQFQSISVIAVVSDAPASTPSIVAPGTVVPHVVDGGLQPRHDTVANAWVIPQLIIEPILILTLPLGSSEILGNQKTAKRERGSKPRDNTDLASDDSLYILSPRRTVDIHLP